MRKSKPAPPAVVWGWVQLRAWTQEVDRKLNLILAELTGKGNVSTELEAAVNKVWMKAKRIDLKVPDLKTKSDCK